MKLVLVATLLATCNGVFAVPTSGSPAEDHDLDARDNLRSGIGARKIGVPRIGWGMQRQGMNDPASGGPVKWVAWPEGEEQVASNCRHNKVLAGKKQSLCDNPVPWDSYTWFKFTGCRDTKELKHGNPKEVWISNKKNGKYEKALKCGKLKEKKYPCDLATPEKPDTIKWGICE